MSPAQKLAIVSQLTLATEELARAGIPSATRMRGRARSSCDSARCTSTAAR